MGRQPGHDAPCSPRMLRPVPLMDQVDQRADFGVGLDGGGDVDGVSQGDNTQDKRRKGNDDRAARRKNREESHPRKNVTFQEDLQMID